MQPITPGSILILFHVLAGFILVGGMTGQYFVFQRAKKVTDVHVAAELLQLFNFFSRKIVSPIGGLTVLLGLITAFYKGFPILGFLQGANINWVLASLVIYILIMALVFSISVPRAKVLGQAVGAAVGKGEITTELTAAMNDSTFNTSFIIQNLLLLLIIVLMITKPF